MPRQTERLTARQLRVVKALLAASDALFEGHDDFDRFFEDFGVNISDSQYGSEYGNEYAKKAQRARHFFESCHPAEAGEVMAEWLRLCEYAGLATRTEYGSTVYDQGAFEDAHALVVELANLYGGEEWLR